VIPELERRAGGTVLRRLLGRVDGPVEEKPRPSGAWTGHPRELKQQDCPGHPPDTRITDLLGPYHT
jgi:hypothetical protein